MNAVEGLDFRKEAGVATVTLNRPDKLNAITFKMVEGLTDFLDECGLDDAVRAIVITGAGEQAFCAGADVSGDLSASEEMARMINRSLLKTSSYPKPIIAAVVGTAPAAAWN